MISQQFAKELIAKAPDAPASPAADIVFGANVLKLAIAFDNLRMKGTSDEQAIASLRCRRTEFDKAMVEAFVGVKTEGAKMELRKVQTSKLTKGMILHQEIRTRAGMLVVAKGQEVSHALVIKLENFSRAGTIDEEIMAMVPA
jgi:hypothetical protein